MFEGIVTSEIARGCVWIEQTDNHASVFCHISRVNGNRVLHAGDRVSFSGVIENPKNPGKFMADDVTYLGRVIARQTSNNGEVR